MSAVPITPPDLDAADLSWFSALCFDDYEFLAVPNKALKSRWVHGRDILLEAENGTDIAAVVTAKLSGALNVKIDKETWLKFTHMPMDARYHNDSYA